MFHHLLHHLHSFLQISFKSILSSKRWRLSLLTYKINSEFAEITSWAYRLSLRLHLIKNKSSIRNFSQLSLQWLRHQIFLISLQSSSKHRYLYSYSRSEESQSLLWKNVQNIEHFFASFHQFQFFWYRISRNNISNYLFASIMIHVLRSNFEQKFKNVFTFSSVYLYLLLTINCMHIQKFAEENALSSYKRISYFCIFHVLIIRSLQFKSELSNHIDLQKSFQSSSFQFSWLSRSLWTHHIYEQVIEITYSVNR